MLQKIYIIDEEPASDFWHQTSIFRLDTKQTRELSSRLLTF